MIPNPYLVGALVATVAAPLAAATATSAAVPAPTYADLATLADGTPLVVRARVKDAVTLPPERAPGVAAGHARLFVEAQTVAVLSGQSVLPEALRYLVDVPLDAKGKVPKLRKQEVIVFARSVPGRVGELQLTGPRAQLAYTPELESRLRPMLTAFLAADAPPRITGVRDVTSSVGNLAGESETQIFLATAGGEPAALTVIRRPGMAPRWGVSWTELVDQAAQPAARDSVAWYRLACTLPRTLPTNANLATEASDRTRAAQDYAFVVAQLGACERNRA